MSVNVIQKVEASVERKEYTTLAPCLCCAAVWKRDTFRYTGRGKSGFEMHYNRERCTRKATHGLFCWQHQHGHHPYYEPQHNDPKLSHGAKTDDSQNAGGAK